MRLPALAVLLTLAACRSWQPAPPVLIVDAALRADKPEWGVIVDERGSRAQFVERELLVVSDDDAALRRFVGRWRGEVVETFDAHRAGIPKLHRIRIDPATAEPSTLHASLRRLGRRSAGTLRISSESGLGLFTAAASAAADGVMVGVNWLAEGSGFRERVLSDAPEGVEGYSPNAFDWTYMQYTRVPEAWRALELAGKLGGERIPIGVIDGGFAGEHDDYPPDAFFRSAYSLVGDPRNVPNEMACGATPCPWHGLSAALSAMAVPNNGRGAAGPGGPVARPILVFTRGDMFTAITAINYAAEAGAKIITMSYGAPIPAPFDFTLLPLDSHTRFIRDHGILLFASAGNGDGDDVDASHCIVRNCWEHTWHYMCEMSGVLCVGATNPGDMWRASSSNTGSSFWDETVDLWAPNGVFVGMERANRSLRPPLMNRADRFYGTSASAPFAAGVAALAWAANPMLSANEVEQILIGTARPGATVEVDRVVDAYGAVIAALGGRPNEPPSIVIDAPIQDARLHLGQSIPMTVHANDDEDGPACCAVTWTSTDAADRFTSTSETFTHVFTTEGPRTVTVTARDLGGHETSARVAFDVVNSSPVAEIDEPPTPLYAGRPFTITGRARDVNEPGGLLACSRVRWSVSVPSIVSLAPGDCRAVLTVPRAGTFGVTLDARDPQGATSRRTRAFIVSAAPENFAPDVEIIAPRRGEMILLDHATHMEANAVDPEGNDPITLVWSVISYDADGNVFRGPVEVGRGRAIELRPKAFDLHDFRSCHGNDGQPADITVTAIDSLGHPRSVSVPVSFTCAPW